uniref:Methyltransferase FkbM domain-containing protein n=1 Tax=viral metagenome TaxID=1070528 RepID=A0A6C0JJU9_9ZZZZ
MSTIKIAYGISKKNIDVTEFCHSNLQNNYTITIPHCDTTRAGLFTDPLFGTRKSIFVTINDITTEYHENYNITINIKDNSVSTIDETVMNEKLKQIQSTLKLNYGSFDTEIPEQKMVLRYLKGNEKVLELGANIGRNTLIIASILKTQNNQNFVTFECDQNIAAKLIENRDINNFTFHIENNALSKRKLIQKGWDTMVSDELLPGYKPVNTITLEELNAKYNIAFDTLVLDCEGAFYYILLDMPEIINNVNLIIMENDYHELSKKQEIDEKLKANGFYRDYFEGGGWGPCRNFFFEVWKK